MLERIGEAYGLVLLLVLITFAVMMTLPPEGWGGRVAAVAVAGLTAVVGLTSSDVRPARVRLAIWIAVARCRRGADRAGHLIGSIARARVRRRRDPARDRGCDDPAPRLVGASEVDFRTILGAISVFTLLGLLFAFLFVGFANATHTEFFTGVPDPRSSDYLFFSYTTLTTTGYGNLVPAGTVGQSFAVFEMLIGQIFLVTLVAGLVSLWRPGGRRRLASTRPLRPSSSRHLCAAPSRADRGSVLSSLSLSRESRSDSCVSLKSDTWPDMSLGTTHGSSSAPV